MLHIPSLHPCREHPSVPPILLSCESSAKQFIPFWRTNRNILTWGSSRFKMRDGKNLKSIKLPQYFHRLSCVKEIHWKAFRPQKPMFTRCLNATMPVLALHLIGRCWCNWNRKCYGKQCACRISVPSSNWRTESGAPKKSRDASAC